MDEFIPVIVFVLLVVVGNILDRKKPTAKPLPQEFPQPNDRGRQSPDMKPAHRPHHPSEYEVVHNPYQEYLTRHVPVTDKAEEALETSPYTVNRTPVVLSPMAKAVIWSEILGKPKALQRR